jgi:hypothetical protein
VVNRCVGGGYLIFLAGLSLKASDGAYVYLLHTWVQGEKNILGVSGHARCLFFFPGQIFFSEALLLRWYQFCGHTGKDVTELR